MKLKSTAECQLYNNKHEDIKKDNRQLERDRMDRDGQVEKQLEQTEEQRKVLNTLTLELAKKDKAIGKCEKKIYQLKKKTQELEKFKYVLDYKIKELKKDIAPREQEIMNLQAETNQMDKKLREFNKTNATLGYLVDNLRKRQKQMQAMIKKTRVKI